MRPARVFSVLAIVLVGWGVSASGGMQPALAERTLTLIPTALQELSELRINSGTKAVLQDGTMSAVYVKHVPAEGNTYLNFHVDLASETGPVALSSKEICLEGAEAATYIPLDWFLDTGLEEVRGDVLTVSDKAIVQFTIEVPRAGLDDLTLLIRSQRIGTVREIRERIAKDGGTE